ncbi:FAD/NAD(P)-binding protein [Bradyrhizobium altum]|uniref:FAD/NAD(P)-binding protein n=1 Tax=Bradyrhizobium altum TaxID=1571202 RepID=UPI0028987A02|nr:FAD/NAD(P)-binding protein [Bradyrhizobium altum]
MTDSAGRHVIIVGGGASGVLLAYQLLHQSSCDLRVTLIEQRPDIGRGIAYHTGNPDHLLNVRAANMSALPDQPDHFWRWLVSRQDEVPLCPDPYCFVPRRVYGDYIASLLEQGASDRADRHRLTIVRGTCVDVSEDSDKAIATLDEGRCLAGDTIVLATGHDMRASNPERADPWTPPSAAPLDADATVLILGTGLRWSITSSRCCVMDTAGRSLRCRDAACSPSHIAGSIPFVSPRPTFRSVPASVN